MVAPGIFVASVAGLYSVSIMYSGEAEAGTPNVSFDVLLNGEAISNYHSEKVLLSETLVVDFRVTAVLMLASEDSLAVRVVYGASGSELSPRMLSYSLSPTLLAAS